MISRDAKEAMNLRGMKGHSQHAIRSSSGQQVGGQASGDRDTRRVLFIGACVGIVRNDGSGTRGGGSTRGIEHKEQLHEMFLHRLDKGLNNKDIALATIGIELHIEA